MPQVGPPRHFEHLAVLTYSSRVEMGTAAAGDVQAAIDGAIASRGSARIILASAPSQNEFLEVLTGADIPWNRVTIFHMDEYVGVAAGHPASFRAYQQAHVLAKFQPHAFHGIRGEAGDLQAECDRYAALLAEAPIDIVCLGIGENGHLAFNDPPVADFADPQLVKVVELDEVCRQQQVNDGCFPSLADVPRQAITLTIPALFGGRESFCVVPGPRKAAAVHAALTGPLATACPASILRTHRAARLYLDSESAALL
jgi:glucosamine-6-phosphate deaminase